jgi:hypothetical protein
MTNTRKYDVSFHLLNGDTLAAAEIDAPSNNEAIFRTRTLLENSYPSCYFAIVRDYDTAMHIKLIITDPQLAQEHAAFAKWQVYGGKMPQLTITARQLVAAIERW